MINVAIVVLFFIIVVNQIVRNMCLSYGKQQQKIVFPVCVIMRPAISFTKKIIVVQKAINNKGELDYYL